MPELPEVEIVRKSLDKKIKQKTVKKVIVRNKNLRFRVPSNFEELLINKKIVEIKRFSKYLILCLSNKSYCVIHLGMSGTIHLVQKGKKGFITNVSFYNSPSLPIKHNHVEIFGTTENVGPPKNIAHGDGPISLQNHCCSQVSFRNIWMGHFFQMFPEGHSSVPQNEALSSPEGLTASTPTGSHRPNTD